MDADLLQATVPSAAAREELRRLVEEPTFRDSAGALRTLLHYRAVIAERPLLDELANALCRNCARRVIGTHAPGIRLFLDFCGLRGELAEQVVYDGTHQLHVCAGGRSRETDPTLKTACGLVLGRSDIHPAPRGVWRRPASSGLTRCPLCEGQAQSLPDCNESTNYGIMDAPGEQQLSTALAEVARVSLDRVLESGQLPDEDTMDAATAGALDGALNVYATQALYEGGASALAHAVSAEHWRALRQAGAVAKLDAGALELEDWEEWVVMHRPQPNLSAAEYRQRRENAQSQLFAAAADAVGLKRH
jgi:hypothetical protein